MGWLDKAERGLKNGKQRERKEGGTIGGDEETKGKKSL